MWGVVGEVYEVRVFETDCLEKVFDYQSKWAKCFVVIEIVLNGFAASLTVV